MTRHLLSKNLVLLIVAFSGIAILFFGFLSHSFAALVPTTTELVPYQSFGYRYKVIPHGPPIPTFEQPGFDDSLWSTGMGAFGSGFVYCDLQNTVQTNWPVDTQLLVRKQVSIPAGATNVKIKLAVDNYLLGIFVNGTQVAGQKFSANCPSRDDFVFDVPQSSIKAGENLIVFWLADVGVESYFDAQVTAAVSAPSKTPVLIVPGTMGTEMFKGGEKLWMDINRLLFTPGDGFMDSLAFNDNVIPVDSLVVPNKILLQPDPKFDYTQALIDDLKSQGYVEGETLFYLPYDWRKDIDDNISVLGSKIDEILNVSGVGKVDIVAHSQGGLIVKRLLYKQPAYQSKVQKLVLLGTPHLGSPKAAKALLYGDSMGVSFLGLGLDPAEIKKIGKNLPAIYQMLPSKEYFNQAPGYWGEIDRHVFGNNTAIVYDYNTSMQRLKDAGLNASLIDRAEVFHDPGFESFDFSGTGVDAYSIVGCQTPTLQTMLVKSFGKDKILYGPGDETVPLASSSHIKGTTMFYSLDAVHGTMFTAEGTRHKIVNLIAGTQLPEPLFAQDPGDCLLNGWQFSSHSPVTLHVYDQFGNHLGPNPEGGLDTEIPGSSYDTISGQTFVFVPAGFAYTVTLDATDKGEFSFYSTKIFHNEAVSTAYYHEVPIVKDSEANIVIQEDNTQVIYLDSDGNGVLDAAIEPSAVLGSLESKDLAPPVTSVAPLGTQGDAGYFRSNVSISLSAQDLASPDSAASGVLSVQYRLDNSAEWQVYTSPISFIDEGQHVIYYYAIDNAGNEEGVGEFKFVIDKTVPEISMQWSVAAKDLVFTGMDNRVEPVVVTDLGRQVSVTDKAGNRTVVQFVETNRRLSLKATLNSISYNGVSTVFKDNKLVYYWLFNSKNVLTMFSQYAASQKDYYILGTYDGKRTTVTGLDKTGSVNKKFPGLAPFQVQTKNGILHWSVN